MRKPLLILILLLLASVSWSGNIPATFYVDSVLGSDNSSTTTGTSTDNAWATVSKVNTFSRQNLLIYSEQFDNASWVSANDGGAAPVVTPDNATILAPDGTATADQIVFYETTTGKNVVYQAVTVSAVPHTGSIWLRTASGTTTIYFFTTPDAVTYFTTTCNLTSTWQRFAFSGTLTATTWYVFIGTDLRDVTQSAQAAATIYAWGADLKAGGLSPYIPTVATAVTASFQPGDSVLFKRGQTWAETLTVPSSGTEAAPITYGAYGTGAYPSISGFDANGQTNVLYGTDTFTFTDVTGATLSTVYTSNAVTHGAIDNQAATVSITGGTFSVNGGAYGSDNSTVIPGDNVTVRVTSSGAFSTAVNAALTIGSTSDTYTVTTRYGIPGRFPEMPMFPSFPTIH